VRGLASARMVTSESVSVTYRLLQQGGDRKATYTIFPLDMGTGEGLQYYCPFPGCVRHPDAGNKGCSRSTINKHGLEGKCEAVTLQVPPCTITNGDRPWFILKPDKPESHAGSAAVTKSQ
jgi:hypothetical protein